MPRGRGDWEMRLFSPYTVLLFVVVWTLVFLLASRWFLFSAHQVRRPTRLAPSDPPPLQSWFEAGERELVQELSVKLENLDSRDTRQLNEVYAEVKRVEGWGDCSRPADLGHSSTGIVLQVQRCLRFGNCSERQERATRSSATRFPVTIDPPVAVLVITCNRESYVRRTLDSLLK